MDVPAGSGDDLTPVPTNIVKSLRLSYDLGVSTFASRAGVSDKTVVRTEQGTYRKIPGAMVHALERLDPRYTAGRLQAEYSEYVTAYRKYSQTVQPFAFHYPYIPKVESHPLTWHRTQSGYGQSILGFCTAFCLHPSTVRRFEAGKTFEVPEQLREWLRDTGFETQHIIDLREANVMWRHLYDKR